MATTIPSSTAPAWTSSAIIYLAVVGPILICALIEWFLWLAAFCYCLCKAYVKADHWSSKALTVLMTIIFVVLRAIFLPVMAVTLPLPDGAGNIFPRKVEEVLQWFAFYTFAVILTVPWLICCYRIIVYPFGPSRQIKHSLNENTAPKVVVVMPVYKEPRESLFKALDSVVACEYPAACIHVFVSFDGDDVDELYLALLDRLGVPCTIDEFPRSIDVEYNNARVTVSRFPHGGKRHCQKATFRLIDKIYKRYLARHDDLFILFIDSDCILHEVCIQNFMYEMELRPDSKGNMLAMTGVITATTEKHSFITLLQDMEYIHGQMYERSIESGCGAVTCLPGALTILRFSAFRNMARFYFSDQAEQCEDLFDYGKTHLGEDRWLTHLFMIGAKKRYQIQMCTSAFCKTEAVQTFQSLLKQRRRWFLGFITNENTIRTTALLFLILVISVICQTERFETLPWQFIGVSLFLNWLMMVYFAIRLGRWKVTLYPIMFVTNPFMNWIYMVHGIFTAGQRTWGGPRADAATADSKTTPRQAIEQATARGDDLNIVPESFKPAIQARKRRNLRSTLQPSDSAVNRFVASEGGNAGNVSLEHSNRGDELEEGPQRQFDDATDFSDSDNVSIHTPVRADGFRISKTR